MYKLFPHNQYAYDKLKDSLITFQRACIVQPTGTGKSFIIAEFLKENPNKSFLLLSSNNYIINQFNNKFKSLYNNYNYISYPSLLSINSKEFFKKEYDYIVLDEFHRVGAKSWGNKVQKLLNHHINAKIIGLTATHIRYMEEDRDMIKEIFDGNIIHNLSLKECFDTGILPTPKYISTIYNIDDEFNNLIKKIDKSLSKNKYQLKKRIIEYRANWEYSNGADIILKKHIKKEKNFLIFCRNINHLKEMLPIVKNWFKIFNKGINIFKVYSEYSESKEELMNFENSLKNNSNEFNLLFSIQQLNEGLHIPNIDGVLFLRPTDSHIIYYQQLGRCLQTKGKRTIVFDMVNNFKNSSIHYSFKELKYDKIFNNGYLKNDYEKYKYSFDIIDEVKNIKKIFNEINNEISDSSINAINMLDKIELKISKQKKINSVERSFLSMLKNGKIIRNNNIFRYPYFLNLRADTFYEKYNFRYKTHVNLNYFNWFVINLCSTYKSWKSLSQKDKNKIRAFTTTYLRAKNTRPYLDNVYYLDIINLVKDNLGEDLLNRRKKKNFDERYLSILKNIKNNESIDVSDKKWIDYKVKHLKTLNSDEFIKFKRLINDYFPKYISKFDMLSK